MSAEWSPVQEVPVVRTEKRGTYLTEDVGAFPNTGTGPPDPLWRHTPPIRPPHFLFTRYPLPRLVLAPLPAIFGDLTRSPAPQAGVSVDQRYNSSSPSLDIPLPLFLLFPARQS